MEYFEKQGVNVLVFSDQYNGMFFDVKTAGSSENLTGWTDHQSFVQYKDQWYLFYHQNAYSPKFDKNRSICIDSLFFNTDGTIRQVTPTLRGVGLTSARDTIEIDRYSSKSETGSLLAFLDSTSTFRGWKTILNNRK